ncbi:hypothetical protein [Chondromyces apiculatus]|uniref:Uncharacterized protein n=1 Tax=Chondromyces apiculatus DSM 436 TaxID=1192034 RepID=A0A017T008_9BACT|nr:hypothetical protein [Chondromyces apiculatus]EYF02549.1 Hypothetical protein CAP_6756 [Chondromyces apiculatus DSM 436]
MSVRQRDYILRMIDRLAQSIGRVIFARKAGKHEEAAMLLKETADGVFGPMRSMLDKLDATSAAMLLGSVEKVTAYALILSEDALNREAVRDPRAAAGHLRALEVYLEAARLTADLPPSVLGAIAALRDRVDLPRLPLAYRNTLAGLPLPPAPDAPPTDS